MAKMLGQEVDPALIESIKREEFLNRKLFEAQQEAPKPAIVVEEALPPPAPAFEPPVKDTVQQVASMLKAPAPPENKFRDAELEGMRKTIAEMMKKISTLSWGGGGTGSVNIMDMYDFLKETVANGRYMTFRDGKFYMDEINPYEIVHNTTLVESATYTVQDTDYYIGVNYAGPVTITIPSLPSSGREIVIKDESGNCEANNITVSGPVDNDNAGFILAVNNGAVHMLFRGNYWRII